MLPDILICEFNIITKAYIRQIIVMD